MKTNILNNFAMYKPLLNKKEHEFHLVQKALAGDQISFSILFNRYYPYLERQIIKIIKTEEAAADITMITFERAFESLSNYTPDFAFSTWLYRIGINCAIDYVRKNKRMGVLIRIDIIEEGVERTPPFQIADESRTPVEQAIFDQRIQYLKGLMAGLPDLQRRCLELRHFEDFSYAEIADELDLPLGTIKAKIHRAKLALSEMVSRETLDNMKILK